MTQTPLQVATADPATYRAAWEDVVWIDESSRGRARLTGRDRAELLQRLTTNDIVALAPGSGARTVLLNNAARILDLLTVYALPEQLLVTTAIGPGATLARFLRGKIFFNDQVAVEDLSDATGQLQLYGPRTASLIGRLTGLDVRDWPVHHVQAATIADAQAWIARTLPLGGDGFVIIAGHADLERIHTLLADVRPLDRATLEVLRIEQGHPAPRRELSTEYIPLETGLRDAICFSKGCYVGQEIIARMESRGRIAKRLMGLRLERLSAPGGHLRYEAKEAGDFTSAAASPRYGPIGLAYVRTAVAVAGTQVELPDGSHAEVVELPFTA